MSTEERNRILLEMQARIEEAKAKEAVRTAERLAKYETIEIVINGRKYFKLIHKESGLGMWSHDVAIEEAKRNKAKSQQLNSEHP